MYQALYRKWRPRTFDEVVGQTHITETLKRQVAAGRLSHAYLFTGTRGTGKTTCAKILARAVNCENPVDGNPCNRCPSCLGIENGSVLDVLELDAASNNGVDQIRALREEAIYTPAAVRKRVYIVDEVHMLSTPAFNALLKILEEPPAHLMFILATTELHKVPATIKSRCQQFAFKRISPQAIAGQLAHVAREEALALAPQAAELLARLADGGLRDGLSLLDQCSGAEGELTEAVVLEVLGLAGNRQTARILDGIAKEDTAAVLRELDALYRDGKDMGAFLGELSTLIRDLLIRKTAPSGGQGLLVGGYEEPVLQALEEQLTAAELVQMMGLLQAAQGDLYRSSSRRLDVELCLIRLCDRRLSDTLEGLAARVSRLEARGPVASPSVQEAEPAYFDEPLPPPFEESSWQEAPPPQDMDDLPPWDPAPEPPPQPVQKAEQPSAADQPVPEVPQEASPTLASAGADPSWQGFLANMQALPPMVQSLLRKPEVVGVFDAAVLTLWVDSDFIKGVLSSGDTVSRLEQAVLAYTGQQRQVILKAGKLEVVAAVEPEPAPDPLHTLLETGRQYQHFTVKE